MNLRQVPIGLFGAVMGLTGLGLSARAAATVLPGYVRAPAYVTEPWIALGVIAFLVLLAFYLVKLIKHPDTVRDEFVNPATLGFCGALPVGMTLVAGGLAPYMPAVADVIWWLSAVVLLAFQLWAFYRLLSGGMALAEINAGWLILFVGGIVAPGPGIALGHAETSHFLFGVSAVSAPLVLALLMVRLVLGPAIAPALRPTWFILLVPPSLIYANGLALFPGFTPLENLYFFGLLLACALLVYARGLLGWPFSPAWWAFTFPLDALAYAAARYAQDHPAPLWKAVAAVTLLLAAAFVVLALARSIALWRTPRSDASLPA